jgi:hypothetical protein
MPTVTTLPKIIQYLHVTDAGPSDDGRGSTVCPHCGSPGRYVHHFVVEGGERAAAMSGCVKLFPVAKTAALQMKLSEKLRKLQGQYGKDATLNSWDTRTQEALDKFFAGEISEDEMWQIQTREAEAAFNWRQKKFGGRR